MKRQLLATILILSSFLSPGAYHGKEDKSMLTLGKGMPATMSSGYFFHRDSLHNLNFRYPGEPRGLKPFYAPVVLIAAGSALHFSTACETSVRDFALKNFAYHGSFDDDARYAPFIAVYALNLIGIKGENNFGNRTAIAVKSILLNSFFTDRLKIWTNVQRPYGGTRSFPSGHTSLTFAAAHFLHHEYGKKSPWFSIGAYGCATTVGLMRVAKDAHWISDVVAGAGVGILSTELVYLTHQYKWDNEHLRRFDIFLFQMGKQKGITMVYTF